MPDIGLAEVLIVAVLALLLLGPGKVADVGGALGKSLREFRRASAADDGPPATLQSSTDATGSPGTPAAAAPVTGARAASSSVCQQCGAEIGDGQRYCTNCGSVRGGA